jgi:hypothetical protein
MLSGFYFNISYIIKYNWFFIQLLSWNFLLISLLDRTRPLVSVSDELINRILPYLLPAQNNFSGLGEWLKPSEHLPSRHKVLSPNPSNAKKTQKTKNLNYFSICLIIKKNLIWLGIKIWDHIFSIIFKNVQLLFYLFTI